MFILFTSIWQNWGLSNIYNQFFSLSSPERYELEFREHCESVGRPLVKVFLWFVLGTVIVSWPADYLFYPNKSEILRVLWNWRITTIVVCCLGLGFDWLINAPQGLLVDFSLLALMVVAFSVYYSLGKIGGLDTPWFYSAYGLPFATIVFFNLPFKKRALYTLGISITCVTAYFGFHPAHLNDPYVGTPLLWIGVFSFFSLIIGQAIHIIYKRSYIKSRQLEESLRDRETLFEEMHHRVKNNMQVITSLLDLEAREVDSDEFKSSLDDITKRVQSMALIHENLYRSRRVRELDLHRYIEDICRNLINSRKIESEPDLNLDIQNVELTLDHGVACGLIVNELVSNALEHGLNGNPEDKLNVSVHDDNEEIILKVSDNGPGLDEEFDRAESSSAGIVIVRSLVEHELNGTIEFDNQEGLTVVVRFEK